MCVFFSVDFLNLHQQVSDGRRDSRLGHVLVPHTRTVRAETLGHVQAIAVWGWAAQVDDRLVKIHGRYPEGLHDGRCITVEGAQDDRVNPSVTHKWRRDGKEDLRWLGGHARGKR